MTFDEFRDARTQVEWDTGDHITELLQLLKTGGFPNAVASAGADSRIINAILPPIGLPPLCVGAR